MYNTEFDNLDKTTNVVESLKNSGRKTSENWKRLEDCHNDCQDKSQVARVMKKA